jgi:predicted DNA-binding protein (MmcQ/YjbR family)
MNIEEFREYCLSLPGTTEGLPFDDKTLVFYVKKKMFALTDIDDFESINLKCDPDEAILLREEYEAVIPGYHMNKKHWNTVKMDGSVKDEQIKKWIKNSYGLVVAKLPRKIQQELKEEI